MKTYTFLLLINSVMCMGTPVQAQGNFVNLGFESANLAPVPAGQFGGEVSSLDAIPGWTC